MANNLRELLERGIVSPALLPDENDFILSPKGKEKRPSLVRGGPAALGPEFHNLSASEKAELLNLDSLETLSGYTVPLIEHDYAAKTPVMWNSLYQAQELPIKNIMVVADPANIPEILDALKRDPKYLGGGAGVGFKEEVMPTLDRISPTDLRSVNIIVKENGELVGYNTDAEGLMRSLEEKLEMVGKTAEGRNFVIIGAGGVAQQFARTLAERKAGHIAIVNRTYRKAVALAHDLNERYGKDLAIGVGENMTRGVLLNSGIKADAIINTSDKGSDGRLVDTAMFYSSGPENENISRSIVRIAKSLRPDLIYADIVLPSNVKSISLRVVDSEGIDANYTLDGKPMVIYQAVPAYKLVEQAHQEAHNNSQVPEDEVLDTFRKAAA